MCIETMPMNITSAAKLEKFIFIPDMLRCCAVLNYWPVRDSVCGFTKITI